MTNKLRIEFYSKDKKAKVFVNGVLVSEIDVEVVAVIETFFDPKHFHVTTLIPGSTL